MRTLVKATLAAAAVGFVVALASDALAEEETDPIGIWHNKQTKEAVFFFSESGPCPSGQLAAVHANLETKVVTGGCYSISQPYVIIFYEDGDGGRILLSNIRPFTKDLGPGI